MKTILFKIFLAYNHVGEKLGRNGRQEVGEKKTHTGKDPGLWKQATWGGKRPKAIEDKELELPEKRIALGGV